MPIPMPSPTGLNRNGLFLPDDFFEPRMAFDEAPKLPRAALPGAAGGEGADFFAGV